MPRPFTPLEESLYADGLHMLLSFEMSCLGMMSYFNPITLVEKGKNYYITTCPSHADQLQPSFGCDTPQSSPASRAEHIATCQHSCCHSPEELSKLSRLTSAEYWSSSSRLSYPISCFKELLECPVHCCEPGYTGRAIDCGLSPTVLLPTLLPTTWGIN